MKEHQLSRRGMIAATGAIAALYAPRVSFAQELKGEIPEQVNAAIASATYRAESVLTEICVDDEFDVGDVQLTACIARDLGSRNGGF